MTKSIYGLLSAAALAGGLCFAGPAYAVPEVELNNLTGTATPLGALLTTLIGTGEILDDSSTNPFPPGDVDFFSFSLGTPSFVQMTTIPQSPEGEFDTILTLFDGSGVLVAHPLNPGANPNNDGGPFSGVSYSQIPFLLLPGGSGVTYVARVEGNTFANIDPDTLLPTGTFTHETGLYELQILRREAPIDGAPVPEPASLVLLGSGLAGLALWRRKRA